jgi:hypothetical protein
MSSYEELQRSEASRMRSEIQRLTKERVEAHGYCATNFAGHEIGLWPPTLQLAVHQLTKELASERQRADALRDQVIQAEHLAVSRGDEIYSLNEKLDAATEALGRTRDDLAAARNISGLPEGMRIKCLNQKYIWTGVVMVAELELLQSSASPAKCPWCQTDAAEAAKRHEGPHATWCVHFREEQRGGASIKESAPQPAVPEGWGKVGRKISELEPPRPKTERGHEYDV